MGSTGQVEQVSTRAKSENHKGKTQFFVWFCIKIPLFVFIYCTLPCTHSCGKYMRMKLGLLQMREQLLNNSRAQKSQHLYRRETLG